MNKKSIKLQKLGGVSAFYGAGAFLIAIIFFLLIVDYPSLTEQIDKIEAISEKKMMFTIMYLISYVFFGFFLVALSFAIHEKLKITESKLAIISTAFGLIWATLLIGSGMVFITGIKVTLDLYAENVTQAVTVFTAIEAVSLGLGFAYGEIMGGIWIITVSLISLKYRVFHKGLNILGIVIGVVGIASILPPLNDIGGLFGILLIFWFVWIGLIMIRSNE